MAYPFHIPYRVNTAIFAMYFVQSFDKCPMLGNVSRSFRTRYVVLIAVLMLTVYLFKMTVVGKDSSDSVKSGFYEQSEKMTSSDQSSPKEDGVLTVLKKNLMFIRTHKCGTSTLVNIFYLFGVRRRLSFVMKPNMNALPDLQAPSLPPRPGSSYNIQCQHVTFDPKVEHEIMPRNKSLYVTVARSTVSHFRSGFTFFGAETRTRFKYSNATMDELIGHYLDSQPEPTEYQAQHDVTLNSIASDLGWKAFSEEMEGSTLQDKIDAFIKHLDQEIDFVMITERMDESLIILKEYLGWNMTDIVYLKRTVSSFEPHATISDVTTARILKYQVIDDQIYRYFNASFEKHLDRVGREKVASQVKEFREMREAFENKCFNKSKIIPAPYGSVSWEISDYGKNVNVACTFLQITDSVMIRVIDQVQRSLDYTVPINQTLLRQDIVSKIQRDYDNNEDPV